MLAMDGGIGLRSDFESPAEIGAQLQTFATWALGQRIIVQALANTDELSSVHQIGFGLEVSTDFGGIIQVQFMSKATGKSV